MMLEKTRPASNTIKTASAWHAHTTQAATTPTHVTGNQHAWLFLAPATIFTILPSARKTRSTNPFVYRRRPSLL